MRCLELVTHLDSTGVSSYAQIVLERRGDAIAMPPVTGGKEEFVFTPTQHYGAELSDLW